MQQVQTHQSWTCSRNALSAKFVHMQFATAKLGRPRHTSPMHVSPCLDETMLSGALMDEVRDYPDEAGAGGGTA